MFVSVRKAYISSMRAHHGVVADTHEVTLNFDTRTYIYRCSRQTDRQTDRQTVDSSHWSKLLVSTGPVKTDRQIRRKTDRQTDKQETHHAL